MAVGLGVLIAVPRGGRASESPQTDAVVRYQNERRYAITHTAAIDVGDAVLPSVEIWLPVPTDQPEQEIHSLKIEPDVPLVRDVGGQATVAKLYRAEGLPSTDQTVRLEVSYEAVCRAVVPVGVAGVESRFASYRKDRQYQQFTRAEKKIEIALPAIVEQAEELRGEDRTPLEVARAAYDWVLERTEYRLIEGFGGAAYCLENGHGECTDYSALFVAVCRAAGIPARPVVGFYAHKTNGWHCWAEFMLPSGHWIPVDPSVGDESRWSRRRYFGGLGNRRVALAKTFDVTLEGPRIGHQSADFLQTGLAWWFTSGPMKGDRRPEIQFSVTGTPIES
jgi:hypothetical protein